MRSGGVVAGALALVGCLNLVGCAPDTQLEEDEGMALSDEELAVPGFDRNRLLADSAFIDAAALTAEEIQAFLETTPYGTRSGLADYQQDGVSAAQAIAQASVDFDINPLAILTRAQLEQSLVFKSNPSTAALDKAFGCGCPDGKGCSTTFKGFNKQVACMAGVMRSYLDDLEGGGSTIAGWNVGKSKKTLDGLTVTPANAATAALYTYTPWVGSQSFGNVAHFAIWNKFASFVEYLPVGPGGCPPATFPMGWAAFTYPDDGLREAYEVHLGGFGLASTPMCFLDSQHLEDPLTGQLYPTSKQVAAHFRLSELLTGNTSRNVLVEDALVERLEAMRVSIGLPVTVVDGYRSPERHVELCQPDCPGCALVDQCEVTLPLTLGQAAVVKASAAPEELLAAASASGFSTCFATDDGVFVSASPEGLGCPLQ